MNKNIFWCKSCLNTSTRPRIIFDEKGVCNACIWTKEKKKLKWSLRLNELKKIISKIKKNKKGFFDVVVPVRLDLIPLAVKHHHLIPVEGDVAAFFAGGII